MAETYTVCATRVRDGGLREDVTCPATHGVEYGAEYGTEEEAREVAEDLADAWQDDWDLGECPTYDVYHGARLVEEA